MTDWQEIADAEFAVPPSADLDGVAADLAEALADPDPGVRDGPAYAVLGTWLRRGVLDAQLARLGDAMAARFSDPRVQARSSRRMLADTHYVWRDQEDDRLGYAIASTLVRPGLTTAQSTDWLELVDERFATGEPGPVPAYASNTMRTLRVLYLLADRGVRAEPGGRAQPLRHRDEVKQQLARSLSAVGWFAG